MAFYPVIMAGGSGTRFWPLSRKSRPKQFLPLSSDKPLLVETADRLQPLAKAKDIYVVCGPIHAAPARRMLKKVPPKNVLVEPEARNTAPCAGLAAAVIHARDPEAVMALLPADHHIANPAVFREALAEAIHAAEAGALVTIGIKPNRPETGFGYIQLGKAAGGRDLEVFEVQRFVEKPDRATAETYLASGGYLWNAGIFVFKASRMLEELKRHMPETRKPLEAIERAAGTKRFEATLKRAYKQLPATSIDYGVMEKASGIKVVPAHFGWSDVGSFSALPEVRAPDQQGNVVSGNAIVLDSEGSVVVGGDERLVAVVGVKDLVVVDAGDALLVVPKSKAQDVRKVVEELGKRRLAKLL